MLNNWLCSELGHCSSVYTGNKLLAFSFFQQNAFYQIFFANIGERNLQEKLNSGEISRRRIRTNWESHIYGLDKFVINISDDYDDNIIMIMMTTLFNMMQWQVLMLMLMLMMLLMLMLMLIKDGDDDDDDDDENDDENDDDGDNDENLKFSESTWEWWW